MEKEKCFVIQPFGGYNDNLYNETFEPAIKAAGLKAYRVDKDPEVEIPIETIESKISEAAICFADISTNNPNVWYELGYAFACKKKVVMICSKNRGEEFPFDIRHKKIIGFTSVSKSCFEQLEENITTSLKALINKDKKQNNNEQEIDSLNELELPFLDSSKKSITKKDNLKDYEQIIMATLTGFLYEEPEISFYMLKKELEDFNLNKHTIGIGLYSLEAHGLIKDQIEADHNGNEYKVISLTPEGKKWVLDNKELILSIQKPKTDPYTPIPEPYDGGSDPF